MAGMAYRLRVAERADVAALFALQERSLRELGRGFYAPEVIEGILSDYRTMDPEIVDEGHYYVAVVADGSFVGCGGWSSRLPGYDGGDGHAPAAAEGAGYQALIRSVFVSPDCTRQGIGRAIVAQAEATAAAAGAFRLGLTSTLPGVPLYRALGYREVGPKRLPCRNGVVIETLEMAKELGRAPEPPGNSVAA